MRLPHSILAALIAALIAALMLGTATAEPSSRRAPVRMRQVGTVVIDAGHGGANLGAPNVLGGYEKTITLDIALRVERLLQARTDADVYLTRRDDRDIGLRERVRFANQVGADVFLSIHCNAALNPRAHGVEVFFLSAQASDVEARRLVEREGERLEASEAPPPREEREVALILKDLVFHGAVSDSATLASHLLSALVRRTGSRSRGVKQAPFDVLSEAKMPAVVVEVGFISHPEEAAALATTERREAIAAAIVEALVRYDRQMPYR